MKSKSYWQKRFEFLENQRNKTASQTVKSVTPAFDQAQAQIDKEINAWYARFAQNNEISLTDAKKLLNSRELKEFRWDVQEYIKYGQQNALDQKWMKQLENASARFHISRLEALKIRTQNAAERAFGNELDALDEMATRIYMNDYYHTAYEIQKGLGIGWDVSKIDQRKLDNLLSKPWTTDKQTFSDRIWKSKTQLIDSLHTELTQMCILGKAPDQTISNIAKRMDVSKGQAGRLIMTEATYFGSVAQKDCFNDLDVEKYEIVATLDNRTSEVCQQMDGKVFDMKDFEAGVTAPPFHCWCRSCTVPWFEDNDDGTRAARGEDGKTYQVPASMKYEDWKKTFVDGGSKDGLKVVDLDKKDVEKDYNALGRQKVLWSWEDYRKKFIGNAVPITNENINDSWHDTIKLPTGKPQLCEDMLHTLEDLNSKYYSPLNKVIPMDKQESVLSNAFASTTHQWETGSCEIRYNPIKISEKGITRLKELSENGYMPKIQDGDEIKYIITHEYGHSIINIDEKLPSKSRNFVQTNFEPYKKARKELEELHEEYLKNIQRTKTAWESYSKPLDSRLILEGISPTQDELDKVRVLRKEYESSMISKYSLTNVEEFVAEGFADAELGTNSNKYSLKVRDIIIKYFGKDQ